ncbi:cytochrome c family protein [Nocardioides sp. DS6]|uniref:Cytochrome c family protein n=1 Tax=Nocardioides eburneus TaxID=3231482 RepID=A0ABV3T3R0_9ACTN
MTTRPRTRTRTVLCATAGWLAVSVAAVVLASCGDSERDAAPPQVARSGDPGRGAQLISSYGCSTCHTVPGVADADGLVGPPLTDFARRSYIAGKLPNTEANLHRWIENPQAIEPGTAMPDLGVTPQDAADITAYLYTLR